MIIKTGSKKEWTTLPDRTLPEPRIIWPLSEPKTWTVADDRECDCEYGDTCDVCDDERKRAKKENKPRAKALRESLDSPAVTGVGAGASSLHVFVARGTVVQRPGRKPQVVDKKTTPAKGRQLEGVEPLIIPLEFQGLPVSVRAAKYIPRGR